MLPNFSAYPNKKRLLRLPFQVANAFVLASQKIEDLFKLERVRRETGFWFWEGDWRGDGELSQGCISKSRKYH